MKILLSAYACEPGKGSEPGVGWHWAMEIARLGYEVHVITRTNNRPSIEDAVTAGKVPEDVHFHYFDLKPWQKFWKRGSRGVHAYALLWQWGASSLALALHKTLGFSRVHHLTFGSTRLPSFMWRLGLPLVLGPLGGGESAPPNLRRHYPFRGRLADGARDLANWLGHFDPMLGAMYANAEVIWLKTPDSIRCVPHRHRHKCRTGIEIGIDTNKHAASTRSANDMVRVLYVGRHVFWKGMGLGILAFAQARRRFPNMRLTMVGAGRDSDNWKSLAKSEGLLDSITWLNWVPQQRLYDLYESHDIHLFPSLHDSSGNVILEAASMGLPTVCLDLGGPGVIVSEECGIKIDVIGKSEETVVSNLADTLVLLAVDSNRRSDLSVSARSWARSQTWEKAVRQIYLQVFRD